MTLVTIHISVFYSIYLYGFFHIFSERREKIHIPVFVLEIDGFLPESGVFSDRAV